jgi:pimeloyl-ACP methyl ester carboxylesterase
MRNFATSTNFRDDLATAGKPIAIFAGGADELMLSEKYRDAVGNRATVRIIDGINHMGIVGEPAAVSIIADDVAKSEVSSR